MSDNWNFYPLLVDGELASISVDIGIASSAPVAGYDEMAYLSVQMRQPREDGLSSQDEFEDLIALEYFVTSAIVRDGKAIYVGRNTSGGNRDFFFYTRNASFEKDAEAAMSSWPQYQYQTGCRVDKEWSTYWNFLYPSPEQFQLISNQGIVDRLVELGDSVNRPRQIDHFACFETQRGRDGFVQFLAQNGYTISQTTTGDDGELWVEFYRTDSPTQIDDITIEWYRAAKQNDGEYDGWGCETVD